MKKILLITAITAILFACEKKESIELNIDSVIESQNWTLFQVLPIDTTWNTFYNEFQPNYEMFFKFKDNIIYEVYSYNNYALEKGFYDDEKIVLLNVEYYFCDFGKDYFNVKNTDVLLKFVKY